jgi:hypothetical protein
MYLTLKYTDTRVWDHFYSEWWCGFGFGHFFVRTNTNNSHLYIFFHWSLNCNKPIYFGGPSSVVASDPNISFAPKSAGGLGAAKWYMTYYFMKYF